MLAGSVIALKHQHTCEYWPSRNTLTTCLIERGVGTRQQIRSLLAEEVRSVVAIINIARGVNGVYIN